MKKMKKNKDLTFRGAETKCQPRLPSQAGPVRPEVTEDRPIWPNMDCPVIGDRSLEDRFIVIKQSTTDISSAQCYESYNVTMVAYY